MSTDSSNVTNETIKMHIFDILKELFDLIDEGAFIESYKIMYILEEKIRFFNCLGKFLAYKNNFKNYDIIIDKKLTLALLEKYHMLNFRKLGYKNGLILLQYYLLQMLRNDVPIIYDKTPLGKIRDATQVDFENLYSIGEKERRQLMHQFYPNLDNLV
jgi:hypothetical protein